MGDEKSLDDRGIFYLSGQVDDDKSKDIAEKILKYSLEGTEHIQLIVNSPGGSTVAGFALIDIMEWSRLPVYTTGIGQISSMGLMIFMAGAKGHRVITPRTSILSHRFWSFSMGGHADLIAKRKEEDLLHRRIIEHYKRCTKLCDEEAILKHLLRESDTYLSPEEALEFGIADKVLGTASLKAV